MKNAYFGEPIAYKASLLDQEMHGEKHIVTMLKELGRPEGQNNSDGLEIGRGTGGDMKKIE